MSKSKAKKAKKLKIPGFLKNKWFLIGISGILTIAICGGSLYYYFLLFPKYRMSSFISDVEDDYEASKKNTKRLEEFTLNWENTLNGDLKERTEELGGMEKDFGDLNTKLSDMSTFYEIQETKKALTKLTDKGKEVSESLLGIATYFEKVGEAVIVFNGLNTNSVNLDEFKKLIMDFKSISQQALTNLEEVEPPKNLISLDKDYKDLLRQYVKSADDLLNAVNEQNTKKIESVGKESDAAVVSIMDQLNSDMETFKKDSNFQEEILKMKGYNKLIDENIGRLKTKYRI